MNDFNTENKKFAVGLDIGSSKICGIVLSKNNDQTYNVLALSQRPSFGVQKGEISNIEETKRAVFGVIADLKEKLGEEEISEVVIGISGSNIEIVNENSNIVISSADQIISNEDINKINRSILQSKVTREKTIIHIIPYQYYKDSNTKDSIANPVGHYAKKLDTNVHIITALNNSIKMINLCVDSHNLVLEDLVYQPLASSIALLNEEMLDVGVCVIDIGSVTTKITIFADGMLKFTTTIPFGGELITNDIRKVLRTPRNEAERIKIEYGFALKNEILNNEVIQVKGVPPSPNFEINKFDLCDIIQPRVTELLNFCKDEIDKSGCSDLIGAGYILTGGAANLRAICDLASQVFKRPVGIGHPSSDVIVGVSNDIEEPSYSAVVGLALHSLSPRGFVGETIKTLSKLDAKLKQYVNKRAEQHNNTDTLPDNEENINKGTFEKFKDKVLKFFEG
ncbi:MAG: cell division protein FtsA [Bacteroidetes bacterium]|nr:cell division protein FtsA [Bacteroidota bacterium]